MGTDTPPESSPDVSPGSQSSSLGQSSLLSVLSAVAVSLSTVAAITVLTLRHALDDVPGWAKLLAIATAGVAASEKAKLIGAGLGAFVNGRKQ